ncbi:hypothetical protein HDU84_009603, partial [Entophlyctis sp. JEL0112]
AATSADGGSAETKKRSFEDESDLESKRRPSSTALALLNADEQIAAEALGALANSTESSNVAPAHSTVHFLDRVSAIPLIHNSLSTFTSAYAATKKASLVVKSSMETMENGTKAVLNSLEPALAPLDRFACNQLDKLERSFPSIISNTPATSNNMSSSSQSASEPLDDGASDTSRPTTASSLSDHLKFTPSLSTKGTSSESGQSSIIAATNSQSATNIKVKAAKDSSVDVQMSAVPSPIFSFRRHRSNSVSSEASTVSSSSSVSTVGFESMASANSLFVNEQTVHGTENIGTQTATTAPMITRKPRGMWTSVVQGVQSNLGAMVISEDAVRALKWCLKILQEAAKNIEGQVDFLRRYLASYLQSFQQPSPLENSADDHPTDNSTQAVSDLNTAISMVTQEVVGTLKLVVEMLVKHASSRLPPPARRRVREFILRLPNRWSSLANDIGTPGVGTPQPTLSATASSTSLASMADHTSSSRSAPMAGLSSGSAFPEQSDSSMPTAATSSSVTPIQIHAPPPSLAAATTPPTPLSADCGGAAGPTASPLPSEAQRVLTLAAESSAMLKNVMHVFSQTVIGAEAVLGRTVEDDATLPSISGLRIAGNGRAGPVAAAAAAPGQPTPPPATVPAPMPVAVQDMDLD